MAKLINLEDGALIFAKIIGGGTIEGDTTFSDDVTIDGILLVGPNAAQVGTEVAMFDGDMYVAGGGTFTDNIGIGAAPLANNGTNSLCVFDQSGTIQSITAGARTSQYGDIGYGFGFNGSAYKHLISDYASRLEFAAGGFRFHTSPSGTAGGAIAFTEAMRVEQATGALLIGTAISLTAGAAKLEVNGGVNMTNLPTSAPAGTGNLWNNGGVVNIT